MVEFVAQQSVVKELTDSRGLGCRRAWLANVMVDSFATVNVVECLLVEMQVTLALVVKVETEAGDVLEACRLTGVHRDNIHLLNTVVRELVLKFQEATAGGWMETEYQSGFQTLGEGTISLDLYSQDVSPILRNGVLLCLIK